MLLVSSFCDFPCSDPAAWAATAGDPPPRTTLPPANGTKIFTKRDAIPDATNTTLTSTTETPDPLHPPYAIHDSLDCASPSSLQSPAY